jgi:hypothetical protein
VIDPKIPQTADGHIIYPGMVVFICDPYSIEKAHKDTVYCVLAHSENNYFCVLEGERYFDGEYWNDGNLEHTSRVFSNYQRCLIAAHELKNRGDL